MNRKLKNIFSVVTSIQTALLRFSNEEGQQNLQVKVAFSDNNSIHCIVTGEMPAKIKMQNKNIHLIQKYHDDYLFISGHVFGQLQDNNSRVLSIAVNKASWFVRKKRESVSWFREKYTYENRHALKHAS